MGAPGPSLFICDHCNKECKQKRDLIVHIRIRHGGDDTFACDLCPSEVRMKSNLVKHIQACHHQRIRAFKCHLCPNVFFSKRHLKTHGITHGGAGTFACDVCSMEYNCKSNLFNHIQVHHQPVVRAFKCPLCPNMFAHKISLRLHHANIHEGTKFQCDTCGKLCGRKSNLLDHITLIHQQKRSFLCILCGAKSSQQSYLRLHMAMKHNPNQIECDDCNAKFRSKLGLNAHYRTIHLKLRPFVCVECRAKFTSKCHLDSHVKSVHKKIKMCTCDVCSKSFPTTRKLYQHWLAVHSSSA